MFIIFLWKRTLEGFDGGTQVEDDVAQTEEFVVGGIGTSLCLTGLQAKVLDELPECEDLAQEPADL